MALLVIQQQIEHTDDTDSFWIGKIKKNGLPDLKKISVSDND